MPGQKVGCGHLAQMAAGKVACQMILAATREVVIGVFSPGRVVFVMLGATRQIEMSLEGRIDRLCWDVWGRPTGIFLRWAWRVLGLLWRQGWCFPHRRRLIPQSRRRCTSGGLRWSRCRPNMEDPRLLRITCARPLRFLKLLPWARRWWCRRPRGHHLLRKTGRSLVRKDSPGVACRKRLGIWLWMGWRIL